MDYKIQVILMHASNSFHDILHFIPADLSRLAPKSDGRCRHGMKMEMNRSKSMYEFNTIEMFSRNKLRLSHDSHLPGPGNQIC